ncbi:dynamin family protein [Verrucomicrobiaceae bacterium R5-34]|uniref:Dynamin family protein n=1 Tax=Oceaniferula flava TaxID=2800421 RepID=A0AAE2SCR7_9BACT|nr:dynamin family protein [Oceaniferula flavus]MBK1830954.1 dynamin family protein [Verrucomicrobiaceae bacterium R5-34]MBK1855800.1 dynamin family protein [Oceaniferula flavus]MBM1137107.1 dynamin family protein [Oceaniferula flavus]
MFGEEYFKTRKRLTDVVLRVLELAEKTGAEKTDLLENDITKGLSNPFLFVVCGEVNAGKSTLLNGLFGADVCKTNVLPETDRVQWYRYKEQNEDKLITPILEERYRAVDFLMDFNLVDTPGTNSVVEGHQKITDRFLPVSDLIFWVFPASNPWGASTWDFISKQPPEMLEKSIFIIQQADLRDEKDLDVILGHMRDLSQKRIGLVPPIFPVSGKLAMQAKLDQPFGDGLWRESGYPALEKHISEIVTDSPARRKVLGSVRDAATTVLRNIEDMIELRTRLLEENESFLREIETEVDKERVSQSSDFSIKFAGMREVFTSQSEEIKALIQRQLAVGPTLQSFFSAENIPKKIEASLVDSVKTAVEQQASDDGKHLVEECRKHWETVRPRVLEKLSIPLRSFEEETGGFGETRERFITRMGRAARQAVVNLKIRGGLDMQLANRRAHLKKWLYMVLIFLMASGVTGAMKIPPDPYMALGLLAFSVIFFIGFIIRAKSTRQEILQSFAERLDDAKIPFADALGGDYRDGVRDFYIEYGSLLESVRRHIANAKLELQPNLEQWNSLFLELKEIEQDL